MPNMYDLCIVGAGMVGSAAAKYASSDNKRQICLIGPNEPKVTRDIYKCYCVITFIVLF